MMHLVENVEACVSLYERIEPYEAFGEELREAYLELKHMREEHTAQSHAAPSPKEQTGSEQPSTSQESVSLSQESEEVSDMEQQIGHDVLAALERSVGHADFPARLEAARQAQHAQQAQQGGSASATPELDELLGDYVLISKQDAVDAMAAFIAAYIAVLPEAQSMDSRKLQRALLTSIQELRTSRLKSVWQWGKYLYRGAAFAYSTFAVYQNPWLIRAVVTALWTTTHLLYGMLV